MHRLFVVPTLLISMSVILIPGAITVVLAFFEWDGMSSPVFIGLSNFQALWDDLIFWKALGNNAVWTLIFLTVPVLIGLLAASLLLIARRGTTLFQVIYFLPMVIATVIIARIWQGMIYNPQSGIVALLNRYGFDLVDPITRMHSALYGVAIADLWHWWGFLAVIFYAAMRQVPQDQIESARIEGATFFQLMRWVLIPAIKPTITLMMVMTIIWSFLVFDFIYIMTQGGPAFSSEVLSTYAYRHAFYELRVGAAAASALVISAFGMIAAVFYIRLQNLEGDQ